MRLAQEALYMTLKDSWLGTVEAWCRAVQG